MHDWIEAINLHSYLEWLYSNYQRSVGVNVWLEIVGSFSQSSDCNEDPEMDNRLYQQLSTGWTYRWQQIRECITGPKFMLELSLFMLILLFLNKTMGWMLTQGGVDEDIWTNRQWNRMAAFVILRRFVDRRYTIIPYTIFSLSQFIGWQSMPASKFLLFWFQVLFLYTHNIVV